MSLRTFSIQTLGCKVNAYEGEQMAALLRRRGLRQIAAGDADLRIIHTCSVTSQAASKSRQAVRRATRLPVLQPLLPAHLPHGKTVVTGCWATSNRDQAAGIPGVDAVISHHEDVADQLDRLLSQWLGGGQPGSDSQPGGGRLPGSGDLPAHVTGVGTHALPLLGDRQATHQRALLKVQDGCDAHCTYCIIPRLRTRLFSKPIDDVVAEARQLVAAGHVELVLSGIFLGAYGQPTALRRRQPGSGRQPGGGRLPGSGRQPLAELVEALCRRVPGLLRLRLSSLEPGDLNPDLLDTLTGHPQVVPHLHLPLQSGSNAILTRMNRQYTSDDFRRMIDAVYERFDRPAITTDVIVAFPGESDDDFRQTLDLSRRAGFIHIHAFAFSPRPGTAAARWRDQFVPACVARDRIDALRALAADNSFDFRRQFLGQSVRLLVERQPADRPPPRLRHGRCERYFDVHFDAGAIDTGDLAEVAVEQVTPNATLGRLLRKVDRP